MTTQTANSTQQAAPASPNIAELQRHLFGALQDLRDHNKPVDVERTRALVSISEQIIDSAKVQVSYLHTLGEGKAAFLEPVPSPALPPPEPPTPMTAITNVLTRRSS